MKTLTNIAYYSLTAISGAYVLTAILLAIYNQVQETLIN